MKKLLFACAIMVGFSVAANAQSNAKQSDTNPDPAKVEVAGQVQSPDAVATPESTEAEAPVAKSCCSSKNGKVTASANSKSCCKDGKKSKAHCAEMKE